MSADHARDRFEQVMLDQLRGHRFPSPTLLDVLERSLSADRRDEYLDALIDKIAEVRYPSPELVRRVSRLVTAQPG